MPSPKLALLLGALACAAPLSAQDDAMNQFAQTPTDKIKPEAIAARIAEHRMGDLVIKARPGATITVEQTRHEFLFGTALPSQLVEGRRYSMSAEDRERFLEVFEQNFNYAVHENALKWYSTEREPGVVDYSEADALWEICAERGIPMRGHCVYWEKEEFNAEWLFDLTPQELRAAIVRRGQSVVGHFKGRITEFDLNNEMVHGNFFESRLGYGVINEMAWIVKAANPDAQLYLNDYAVLDMGFNSNQFIRELRNMIASGVPIDGIGLQGHKAMRTELGVDPVRTQRTLDELNEFNLPIKITEALFAYDDEQKQVDELNKLFPIYFAHPNVEAIVFWGFWEGAHWQPPTALWRRDWTPRPQADAYRELVFNQWWTRESGTADTAGTYTTRAFYGNYTITVDGVGKDIVLSKTSGSATVVFE